MKKFTALFCAVSALCAAFALVSCGGISEDVSSATLLLSADTARSVLPDVTTDNLTSLTLKGTPSGGSEQTLGTWSTYTAMTAASVGVTPGTWNFTLTASNSGALLTGTLTAQTINNGSNPITFTLSIASYTQTSGGKGSVSVSVTYPGANVNEVRAGLFSVSDGTTAVDGYSAETLTQSTTSGSDKKVTYGKTDVPSGTYMLIFSFYGGTGETLYLNSWREIITVADGLASKADITIKDLNFVYTITYNSAAAGTDGVAYTAGYTAPASYVGKTGAALPSSENISRTGYTFGGWYTDIGCTGTAVTTIAAGASENKTYWAKWNVNPYFYAASSGTDTTRAGVAGSTSGNGTAVNPYNSVQAAVNAAVTANDGTSVYTVYVDGNMEDTSTTSYTGNNALVSIISSETTNLNIVLCGLSGNAVINAARTSAITGRVVYAEGNVNLTLRNIQITGGYLTDDGGGVCASLALSLVLDSGTRIYGNTAKNGGGVSCAPSFTMRNSIQGGTAPAVYGNTATGNGGGIYYSDTGTISVTAGTIGGSETADGNKAVSGGGIYIGNYPATTSANNAFSGCTIQNNNAENSGGGIYFAAGSMNIQNCTITGNSVNTYNGGGIFVGGGTFNITGGTIEKNTAGTAASADKNGSGAGMYVGGGSVSIKDCGIKENKTNGTSGSGGGLYIATSSGTVTLSGTTELSGNTATKSGNGIYFTSGKLCVAGANTTIAYDGDSKNDIYLENDSRWVTLTSALDSTHKLLITPSAYPATVADVVTVLKADSTYNTAAVAQSDCDNCIITDNSSDSFYVKLSSVTGIVYMGLSGSGTAASPYLIPTVKALTLMRTNVNNGTTGYASAYYSQTADIDLSSVCSSSLSTSWTAIGGEATAFSGTYKGNGKKITGLYISDSALASSCYGLFGVNKGTIKDCSVAGSITLSGTSTEGNCAGGITAQSSGVVQNCTSSVNMDVSNSSSSSYFVYCGGITGLASNSETNTIIDSCSYTGTSTVNDTNTYVFFGGIAGEILDNVWIMNSFNTGKVNGGLVCGGIAGAVIPGSTKNVYIANCYNSGTVINSTSGGIAGYIDNNGGVLDIVNCVNNASVTTADKQGPIAGLVTRETSTTVLPVLSKCYWAGSASTLSGSRYVSGTDYTATDCAAYTSGSLSAVITALNTSSIAAPSGYTYKTWTSSDSALVLE